jgi:hypothetical protein
MKIQYDFLGGAVPVFSHLHSLNSGSHPLNVEEVSVWSPTHRRWFRQGTEKPKGRFVVPLESCLFRNFQKVLRNRASKLEGPGGVLIVVVRGLSLGQDDVNFGLMHDKRESIYEDAVPPEGLLSEI